jgi:hypothetical protein
MKFKIKESQLRRLIKSAINEAITNVKDPSMYYSYSDEWDVYLDGEYIETVTRKEMPKFIDKMEKHGIGYRDLDFRAKPNYNLEYWKPEFNDDGPSYLNCSKESNLHNIIKESIRKSLNESNDIQELCSQFKKWLEYNYDGMKALGEYVYSNELSPQYVIDEFVDYHPEYRDVLDGNDCNQLERIVDICAREYMDEDDADNYNSSIEGNFN